jgi:hypothetical protein
MIYEENGGLVNNVGHPVTEKYAADDTQYALAL